MIKKLIEMHRNKLLNKNASKVYKAAIELNDKGKSELYAICYELNLTKKEIVLHIEDIHTKSFLSNNISADAAMEIGRIFLDTSGNEDMKSYIKYEQLGVDLTVRISLDDCLVYSGLSLVPDMVAYDTFIVFEVDVNTNELTNIFRGRA